MLLADDHPAVAKELCALLQPEFDVIATVGDGDALLAAAHALAPDVIVSDIAKPDLDGIAAASEIWRRNPAALIVFVTVHDEAEMIKKSLAIGVMGYVLKSRRVRSWSRRFTPRCGGSIIFRRTQADNK